MPSEWPSHLAADADFERARDAVESGAPFVFITGRAGTGKSTLIQCLRHMTRKRYAIVAPTGVAALNAGGQTIHSFFRFKPGPIDEAAIPKLRNRRLFRNLELLFIDEISMVRADLLDAMDVFLRKNGRYPSRPFGGIQIVAVGDLFQLPPVVASGEETQFLSSRYATEYFFSARCLAKDELCVVELQTVYRQSDRYFVDLLDRIRRGDMSDAEIEEVNAACLFPPGATPWENAIILTATNTVADAVNARRLAQLPGSVMSFRAETSGAFTHARNSPAPDILNLKEGAQVMLIKNDLMRRWVNGSLATVVALGEQSVTVRLSESEGGGLVEVEPQTWETVRYAYDEVEERIKAEVVGSFVQLPLIPAWAVTVHKSQGKTLERVLIDLGRGAFAPGQAYVALSRARSLESTRLMRPLRRSDIHADPRVRDFFSSRRPVWAL